MDIPIHISHAKEDQVPGTVYLTGEEGDATHCGQALFPIPTNDPLNLPTWRKYCCLMSVVLFTLVGNASILLPAPFILFLGLPSITLRLRKQVPLRVTPFSGTHSSTSSGFDLLSNLVDDLYGCCPSLSLSSWTFRRKCLLN
jgi:hypothetical protein